MKKFLANLSLRARITLVFTLTIGILLVLMIILVANKMSSDFQKQKESQYTQLVYARSEQVSEIIKKLTSVHKLICKNEAFYSLNAPAVQKAIDQYQDITTLSPEIQSVTFIWPDGKGYTSLGKWVNVTDRDYFKIIVSGSQDFIISPPVLAKSTGQPSVIFSQAIKNKENQLIGILNMTINLEALSAITSTIKAEKTGYGWACDGTGQILAFPKVDQIMKLNITDADKLGYVGLDSFAKVMLSGSLGAGHWKKQDVEMVTFYSKIAGPTTWYLGLNIPLQELEEGLRSILTLLFTLLGAGIVITFIISIFLAASIVRPIKRTGFGFKKLAEGDADLTKSIEVINNDEVGKLTVDFNSFVKKLHEIVVSLKESQDEISKVANDLNKSSKDTLSTVLSISNNITQVSEQTKHQTESTLSSSAAVEQIAKNIESLDKIINDQVSSVDVASAAIEQMARNIESVFTSMEHLSNEYLELSKQAEIGKMTRGMSEKLIGEISKRSSSLQEANHAIADIASRTNLLAMNAAIEAAHAGQSGRGFAVVADEIRKLAENSSHQSKSISKDIQDVQQSITELVSTSQTLGTILLQVENKITETKDIVGHVHEAMSEQKIGSSQMLGALETLNNLSASVKSGSLEMKQGNSTLIHEITQLRTTSQQVQHSIEEIAAGTKKLSESAQLSSSMAEQTKESANSMEKAIGRFKI